MDSACLMFFGVNPLIQAVIHNEIEEVKRLKDSAWADKADHYGFSALEIAQFLGRRACQQVLSNFIPPQLHIDGKLLAVEEFESLYNIQYCPFLHFDSYEHFKAAIASCPYLLRYAWVAKEHHQLGERYRQQISLGKTVKFSIQWIDDILGHGLFLEEDVVKDTYIAEYTGRVRSANRLNPMLNAYCFHYPTKWWSRSLFVIDGLSHGNAMRYANHSERPNMRPECVVDRGLLHQIFVADKDIPKGTQLTFDYGEDYWSLRQMVSNSGVRSRFRDLLKEQA